MTTMKRIKRLWITASAVILWALPCFHDLSALALPTEEAAPRFPINRFIIEGNSILPADKTVTLLVEFTGKSRDFGDIQQAIERLEKAYRDRGYTMVTVILPEQELTGGDVRLKIIEPKVKEIRIEGNRHFDSNNIEATLPTLKKGESPQIPAISENLRAANENPAKKITLQFRSDENPEELQALLQVNDKKPWKITLSADNTGSPDTGRYRTGLGLQHFNLFNRDHIAALQYITSPDHADSVNTFSGSYRLPLYKLGDTLDLFGAYSDVKSGTTQISGTNISISGKGVISGFRYAKNLPRHGDYEQKLVAGMDYRLYDNSAVMLNTELAKDVVAHPLSLTYGGSWTTDPLSMDGSLGILYNIPWGGQGGKSDYRAVRSGAEADYLILRYGLNLLLRPGADWMLRIAGAGQYTPDRLIPGEQLGLGGASMIRGYEEREESWDGGFGGSFEIYTPDIAGYLKLPDTRLRLLGFFDGGTGYNLRTQSGELRKNSLKSAGAGLRMTLGEAVSFSFDWGYPLDDSIQTSKGESAVHFSAQISY